jgi:hypothetical protein
MNLIFLGKIRRNQRPAFGTLADSALRAASVGIHDFEHVSIRLVAVVSGLVVL